MGYNIMKSFKIDAKNLIISGRYAVSNLTDVYGKRVEDEFIQTNSTIEEFNAMLVNWANDYLSGVAKFAPSMTFAKRVNWLVKNGLAYDTNIGTNYDWEYYQVENTQEVVDVLSGKTKIKTPMFAMVSVTRGYVLKSTTSGIKLNYVGMKSKEELAKTKGRMLSKLTKEQVDHIVHYHKDFLDRFGIEAVAI